MSTWREPSGDFLDTKIMCQQDWRWWQLKDFLFYPGGNDLIWRAYLSHRLVQPATIGFEHPENQQKPMAWCTLWRRGGGEWWGVEHLLIFWTGPLENLLGPCWQRFQTLVSWVMNSILLYFLESKRLIYSDHVKCGDVCNHVYRIAMSFLRLVFVFHAHLQLSEPRQGPIVWLGFPATNQPDE